MAKKPDISPSQVQRSPLPIQTPKQPEQLQQQVIPVSADKNLKSVQPSQLKASNDGVVMNAIAGWNRNLQVKDVYYDLYLPPQLQENPNSKRPCLVVLPGWDFPRTSWVENTNLVDFADRYGYVLLLPEMDKTLYASAYHPETTLKWNSIPGGAFIKTVFIPAIQKRHQLLLPGQHNTLLGLSTGGRGVALIALENPGLFVAGASLSGDFSQENTPEDRLMTALYGSFSQFQSRWLGRDNPQARASEWTMPIYLSHGKADNIVPESQSRLFFEAIKQQQSSAVVEYHPVAGAGHDYPYWGSQLEAVFKFIDQPR